MAFAQKFFGFDFYFVVKGVRLRVWGAKDFSIDGKDEQYKFCQSWIPDEMLIL